MLILERKNNEVIHIKAPNGDNIEIHMVETMRGRAKLGVDAPDAYEIFRKELLEEE